MTVGNSVENIADCFDYYFINHFYYFSPKQASERFMEETLSASESEGELEDDDPHNTSRLIPFTDEDTWYAKLACSKVILLILGGGENFCFTNGLPRKQAEYKKQCKNFH